jgi:hypothetical protein
VAHDAFANVHRRIAERVSHDTGVDVEPEDVRLVIAGEPVALYLEIQEAIKQEAREYGLLDSE